MNDPVQPRFAGTPVPTPPIPDDDGSAGAELTTRLDEFAAGAVGGTMVLEALSRSRLLVPVVAVLDEVEVGPEGMRQEKQSSMATVLVRSSDGSQALLAFSSIDALTRWREEARPVPLAAPLAARAAVDESADTLLIDVAGPVPFAVTGAELLLVAAVSRSPGEPCDDPVLRGAVGRLLSREARIASATLLPAESKSSADDRAPGPAVLTLAVRGVDRTWLGPFVHEIAADRVVRRLLPQGLRVKDVPESDLSDTPGAVPLLGRVL